MPKKLPNLEPSKPTKSKKGTVQKVTGASDIYESGFDVNLQRPLPSPIGDVFWNRTIRTAVQNIDTSQAQDILPLADNTYDLGSGSFQWRDGYFGRNVGIGGTLGVTGATTLSSTLNVTGLTTLSSLNVTGAASFGSNITLADGINVILATSTGTKIGTATNQKLGFFNAAPVIQRSAFTQTYSTADRTIDNILSTSLTHTVGTADGTVDDVGAVFNQTTLNNNFKECSTQINNLISDVTDLKQAVNALIDDQQALGFAG